MRLFGGAHYDFLGSRRRAYVISTVMLVAGLISIFFHRGLVFGVDFTGGTLVQVRFAEPTTVAEVRDAIVAADLVGAQIQNFESADEFLVRIAEFQEGGGEAVSTAVRAAFAAAYGENGFEVQRTEAVGPKVGSELKRNATLAILMSFVLTLVYLAFRFEWRFGVAAIVATVHDIVITFGFISLLNVEITLATVAAILTIIGYSLNDTIVVFDRIRENLKKRRKDDYPTILNASINETLPRTVLTSGTTLVSLVSLFLLGGGVIRPFALVLVLGITIGTYSSIWVASPALQEIENHSGGGEPGRSR